LKSREVDIKEKQLMIDATAKADNLELEKSKIESQQQIAGMQVGAKSAKDRATLEAKMELEGTKLGAKISKEKAEFESHNQLEIAKLLAKAAEAADKSKENNGKDSRNNS